ncbi:MAG: 50S ribosomal protein L6 [Candidatus Binatia bacterium]|nr:MAG: 50S ribosomal protein L6 [Candidatus Binatia bacterium]
MSRIGRQPIEIPGGVKVSIENGAVRVEGPKGTLTQALPPLVAVEMEGNTLRVVRRDDSRKARAMHGLAQRLLSNAVRGVSAGFSRTLEIVGVGYRVEPRGQALYFTLGYSHPILFQLPAGVTAKVERQTILTLEGIDKQLLGQCAAMIRGLRPPEPYKGKGIRYQNEVLRRKAGKAAGAGG